MKCAAQEDALVSAEAGKRSSARAACPLERLPEIRSASAYHELQSAGRGGVLILHAGPEPVVVVVMVEAERRSDAVRFSTQIAERFDRLVGQ